MIGLRRTRLENQDQAVYRAVIAYLQGRLRERATIDWALQLKTPQTVQRAAILDLIERTNPKDLGGAVALSVVVDSRDLGGHTAP